jgi:hypothetical protein
MNRSLLLLLLAGTIACSSQASSGTITQASFGTLQRVDRALARKDEVTRVPIVQGRSGDLDTTFGVCFHYTEGSSLHDVAVLVEPPGLSNPEDGILVKIKLKEQAGHFCQEMYFDAGDPAGVWRFSLKEGGKVLSTWEIEAYEEQKKAGLSQSHPGDAPVRSGSEVKFVAQHIERLASACKSKPLQPWCAATGFAQVGPTDGPSPGTVLGLTTFLTTEGDVTVGLEKYLAVSRLDVVDSGGKTAVHVSSIRPNNAAGKDEVRRLIPLVRQHLGGASAPVVEEPGLKNYLSTTNSRSLTALIPHSLGWSMEGRSKGDFRKVGDLWVVVEVPQKNPAGVWLNLYPAP